MRLNNKLHSIGRWSLRAVQRELFGYTGGAAYEAVKAVQAQMTAGTGGDTAMIGSIGSTGGISWGIGREKRYYYCGDTRYKACIACAPL